MKRLPAIFLAVLAACGMAACRRGPSGIDPVLEAFVPDDAVMLAGVRAAQLRATPLFEKLRGLAALPSKRLAERTGFDPLKDANELLAASDGKRVVVAARGNFRAVAVPASVPRAEYKGLTLYGAGGDAFVVLDETTALGGEAGAVRAAIDRRGRRPAGSTLLSRARAVPKEHQVWAVASGPLDFLSAGGNFGKILAALGDITAVADFRAGVRAEAHGTCRDEPNARALADALRGMLALGKLAAPKGDPTFERVYAGVRIEQERDNVRVTAEIPEDAVVKLAERLRGAGFSPRGASAPQSPERP